MSTADIVILSLIVLPTIIGIFYGCLNIIFSLLSWVISFWLSIKLVPYAMPLLEGHVDTPILQMMLAFIGLFILILLIMSGISVLIVKLLGGTGLTVADRIFGLFFGMGLGGLIVTIIIFLAGFTLLPQDPWWQESKLIKPFERICVWSTRFLPESFTEYHTYEKSEKDVI